MKHIFVVDDEHNIRDLIRKYLEIEGYKVTCFSSGENVALEIERLRPALIIMDIMMPGIDGLEVCRQIRAKSEVPIIFVSARDEELDRILGLELGADDYLSIFIAGLIALIIGSILGRSLTKPLENLMKYMIEFSLNKPQKQLLIKTGDEIEKLAQCFHKLAEKLRNYDEYQKKFLQNTSHELKTPLMSIQGYAEAIKDGVVEGKEAEESLDIIIEESQRLKKVVEEIIYLTKLENADDTFELTYFKIGLLAEGVVKSLKALAAEKQIDVEIKGDLETGGYFDEGKLRRALINIIANCLRYAKRKVIIDLLNNGSYLKIKIFDDGPGLKDGEEEKIFHRFYKGEQGGSGLGLAITRAIIEGHGGSIEAFKREPTGAVFVITLPLKSKEVCY